MSSSFQKIKMSLLEEYSIWPPFQKVNATDSSEFTHSHLTPNRRGKCPVAIEIHMSDFTLRERVESPSDKSEIQHATVQKERSYLVALKYCILTDGNYKVC